MAVLAAPLDTEDADVVFIAGCEENQVRCHSRFDLIILLSASRVALSGSGRAVLRRSVAMRV
ncbi:MAG TPA: hypothetical protein VN306_16895 [Mycobacterium sp.]|nr:hypothetical protein [Mycobacterium sp.]